MSGGLNRLISLATIRAKQPCPGRRCKADICRDLGILPHHPLWGRLGLLVMQYGGRLRTLLKDAMLRSLPLPGADPPLLAAAPPSPAPAGTGPP
jgi:hypothetical protein